jgi:NAD-dependent dihydropyrimidine dehydrogenase PreA subunit
MKYLTRVVTLEYFPEKCTGCQRCVEVCPRNVFFIRNKKARLIDLDNCIECGACANNCEFEAIKVNAGVGCAAAILNSLIQGGAPCCGKGDSGSSCCG